MALSLDFGIQQFLDHLRVERELTPATVEAYGRDLAAVRALRLRADHHARRHRERHRRARLPGPPERAQAVGALAGAAAGGAAPAFRFFKGERIVAVDPTEDVDLPRFGRKLPEFLSIERGRSAAGGARRRTPRGARDAAMIETLYATGLRVSELVKLRLRDLNFDAG